MENEAAQRYAARIREQADQADAALSMADHVTGHYWLSIWSALDLAATIESNGSPLKMRDGTVFSMADALRGITEAAESMRRDLDDLRKALTEKP